MDINKINKTLVGIVVFLIVSLFFQYIIMCYISSNRFKWKGGIVTSENYPVQIIYSTRYRSGYHHNKIVRNTWDDMVKTTDYPLYEEDFPQYFHIDWYSYNEDLFFEALIPLPSDTLGYYAKKYRKYHQDENERRGIYTDYYSLTLVAELKPGGLVSVWLTDSNRGGERIELFSDFQGVECDLNESVLDLEEGITRKEWNDIITNRKYNWKLIPVIEGLLEDSQIKEIDLYTYANVKYYIYTADQKNDSSIIESQAKYIPNGIRIRWRGNQGESYSTSIHFQAKELSHIFAELYADADSLQQSEILVKFDRYFKEKHDSADVRPIPIRSDYYDATITLRRGDKEFQINTIYGGDAIHHPND